MTPAELEQASALIREGKGEHLYMQSRRASVWRVLVGDKTFTVVYSKRRNAIVTILPEQRKLV